LAKAYENGELSSCNEDLSEKTLVKSYYLWKDDTFSITAGLGMFEGFGFEYTKVGETDDFNHYGTSDLPNFSKTENSKLLRGISVPCERFLLVLSRIPQKGESEPEYGYATFKSEEFYQAVEIRSVGMALPRKRVQNEMTVSRQHNLD
jgi:hypothetical protein